MKNLIYSFIAAAALPLAACSTGNKTDYNADDSTQLATVEQPAAASSTTENFLGLFTDPNDGSTLQIGRGTDGPLNVVISILRLTMLDDGKGEIADNALTFTATDANGNPIGGRITLDCDTATLLFTNSTWDYLPNGTSFRFVRSSPDPK